MQNNHATFRHAMWNGVLQDRSAIRVSPFGDGFMFGRGVFETLKVVDGEPEFWDEHWDRLNRGALGLGLGRVTQPDELLGRCRRLVAAEGALLAVLKIVVFEDAGATGELILLREFPYREHQYETGFSLQVAEGRSCGRSVASLKTQAYIGNLLALHAARAAGHDEVVFLSGAGKVLEGATTNLFAVNDGRVLTPPLSLGVLPGVIRGRLLRDEAAPLLIEEAELTLEDLRAADALFVTNSLLGVMPVRACAGREYSDFKVAAALRVALGEKR